MARPRLNLRRVKTHRSYTIDEAARTLGVAKGTVRRWLNAGLRALTDQRPFLILGPDLAEYLATRPSRKQKCRLDECYCFSCRAPRRPAFGAVEYVPVKPAGGNLRALCDHCSTIMHKRISAANYEALKAILGDAIMQVGEHIGTCKGPSVNENFGGEIKTHA
jgi:excisionase family DNA binding protein